MKQLSGIFYFVTDQKSGRVLEFNRGEEAGIDPVHPKKYQGFFDDVLVPHIRPIVESVGAKLEAVHYATDFQDDVSYLYQSNKKNLPLVILFGFAQGFNVSTHVSKKFRHMDDLLIVNENSLVKLLYGDKGFAHVVADIAGVDLFPDTLNVLKPKFPDDEDLQKIADDAHEKFNRKHEWVVIKPVNQVQGEGVVVLAVADLKEKLPLLLRGHNIGLNDSGFAQKYWQDNASQEGIVQIQAFVEDTHEHNVKNAKETWDPTSRYIWVVETGAENDSAYAHANTLGGFLKYPREPIQSGVQTQRSSISYSKYHGFGEYLSEWLPRIFYKHAMSGAKVVLDDEKISENQKALASKIEKIFLTLSKGHEFIREQLIQRGEVIDIHYADIISQIIEFDKPDANPSRGPDVLPL